LDVFRSSSHSVVLVYPKTELVNEAGQFLRIDPVFLSLNEKIPNRRLAHFIRNINWANPIFGLMRVDALRRTRLIDSFISSDVVLLCELLMLGEFREVPEVLFKRRLYKNRGSSASKGESELRRWFNPFKTEALDHLPVDIRLRVEYARSVYRMPLKVSEKLRCYAVISQEGMVQEVRNLGGRYKLLVKNWYHRVSTAKNALR
jgi:hypothetical protein